MTTGMTPKVRLVKCPKCLQLLPEPEDIFIYQCGGCGALLRAKHRRNQDESAVSELLEGAGAHKNESEISSVDDGSKELGCKTVVSSSARCCSDHNSASDCIANGDSDAEQPGPSSSSGRIVETDQSAQAVSTECDKEGHGGSNDVQSSTEHASLSNQESPLVANPSAEVEKMEEKLILEMPPEQFDDSSCHTMANLRISEAPISREHSRPSSALSSELGDERSSTSAKEPDPDDTENQCCIAHAHLSEQAADFTISEEQLSRQAFSENQMRDSNYRMKRTLRDSKSLSYNSDSASNTIKGSRLGGDEHIAHMRQDLLARSRTMSQVERLESSRPSNFQWDSQGEHFFEGLRDKGHKNILQSSSFRLQEEPEYPSMDKMELLRMVIELEEQLKRTYNLEGIETRRASRQFSSSSKSFSAEAVAWRQQSEYPYDVLHTRHGRQYPDQLRPDTIPGKGSYKIHSSCSTYSRHSSRPFSSQQYADPTFTLLGRETKIEHVRTERRSTKRHFRPTAGGAPLVACYHCSVLLLAPADFFLSTRRRHRLRCGACFAVLELFIRRGIHIVRDTPEATGLPSTKDVGGQHVECESGSPANAVIVGHTETTHSSSFETSDESRYAPQAETEELPRKTSSALHRLMGYSSVSQLVSSSSASSL